MKKLFTGLLMLAALIGKAQVNPRSYDFRRILPFAIIDSVKTVNAMVYFDQINPEDIKSCVVKRNATYPNGVIYFRLKDPSIYKKLLQEEVVSLSDLCRANISSKDIHKTVLYQIDGRLQFDTTGIRFLSKYIKYVTITKTEDLPYLRSTLPHALLMTIAHEFTGGIPRIVIDSLKTTNGINYNIYIAADDMLSTDLIKNSSYPNGAIYIKLKSPDVFTKMLQDKLVSVHDIAKASLSTADVNKTVLYVLDSKLLTDTAGVRIPSKFVRNVTIVKAGDTPYFKTALPNVLLMLIETQPPYIKGTSSASPNNSAQIK